MSEFTGLNEVIDKLNNRLSELPGRTQAGLEAAALMIMADAQRRVPVEYGNLHGSAFVQPQANGVDVEIGFTAHYAAFIHEKKSMKWKGKPRRSGLGVYWGPRGEPQFLTRAVEENADEIVEMVTKYLEAEEEL